MKNWIIIMIWAALALLQSCETITGRSSAERHLEGTWHCTEARLETIGSSSPEDQMIIAMINGMIKEMATNMSITFYKDGDYQMGMFGMNTLGKYDLRADNSLVTFKEEGTTNAEKVTAKLQEVDNKREIVLEFQEELLEDPGFQEMMMELDSDVKMVLKFSK